MKRTYERFVGEKLAANVPTGISGATVDDNHLFEFQRDLTQWALRRGRAAIFAATGLGKSRIELTWAHRVSQHTQKPVLLLAPIAVGQQTHDEGLKIGIASTVCRDGADVRDGINIANYERLHRFDPSVFGGVVCDESSIIKNFNGKTLRALTEAFGDTSFKLLATATPSPNDYTELGTHAEMLGVCSRTEMLSEFFVHDGGNTQSWRLKGHARQAFWRFVASWGALVRSPADLGYDASAYDLPELRVHHHVVEADESSVRESGLLFAQPAQTLTERRAARRGSLERRVASCTKEILKSFANADGAEGNSPARSESRHSDFVSGDAATDHAQRSSGDQVSQNVTPWRSSSACSVTCASTTKTTQRSTRKHENSRKRTTPPGEDGTQKTLSSGSLCGNKREPGTEQTRESALAESCAQTSASLSRSTRQSSSPRAGDARYAERFSAKTLTPERVAESDFTSTTITARAMSEGCSAPTATEDSDCSGTTRKDLGLPRNTSGPDQNKWLVWCALNYEQDELERSFAANGISFVSIRGTTPIEDREGLEREWREGSTVALITKVKCFGYGMNWQHCANQAFVGVDDSWESYHQAVRRSWRFGQKRPVDVHLFASELEGAVLRNLERKENDAAAMAEELSRETRDMVQTEVRGQTRTTNAHDADLSVKVPKWI